MKREIKNSEKEISQRENKQLFSFFQNNIIVGVPWYKKCIPGGRAHHCKYRFTSMITVHKSGRMQTYCVDWIKR